MKSGGLQVRGTGGAAERKTSVAHTVRALPDLARRAYVSAELRYGFANPPPRQHPAIYTPPPF